MSYRRNLGARLAIWLLGVTALIAAEGCARVSTGQPATGGRDAGGIDAPISSDSSGAIDARIVPPRAEAGIISTCTKVSCTPTGGRYCGVIGDRCGGTLDCGSCAAGESCEGGRCVGGASCMTLSCQPGNGRYCGKVGDGCGRELECGACPAGQTCTAGVCTLGAGCVPLVCSTASARYCGTIGDGCGGTLACGDCPTGSTCGGSVPDVCAATNCAPITCTPMGGGQYCGRIGNGCGGALECPAACPGGVACGTGGVPHACPGGMTTGGCVGLGCMIDKCDGKPRTTVTGTVYDPAGRLPLYNVMVYVPNAPLEPLAEGVSCQKCDTTVSGRPVASALTDAAGNFTMVDVPVGANIPVVVQTGKWRRQITLPMVKPCQDNVFPGAETFRLPKSQAEGHLPKIAMVTGRADKLDCMMRVIGVVDTEFTNPAGAGRVNLYAEAYGATASYLSGDVLPPAGDLIGSVQTLSKYDMVIMSCHGESKLIGYAQPTSQKEAVKAYVDQGGRVFGSHFHFSYLRGPPASKNHSPTPFPDVGLWDGDTGVTTFNIERGFPKGQAFAQWLVNVGASTTLGSITLTGVEGTARTLNTPYTRSWISAPDTVPYFSMNMPIEKIATPAEQCGRFVHTGLHVSDGSSAPFPSGCGGTARDLTPQEKAFEFLIFELSSCAIPDAQQPTAPIIPPPGAPNMPPPAVTAPPPPPPPSPPPPPPIIP